MNKLLRYSFVALLAMMFGNVMAAYNLQKVTSVQDNGLYVFEQDGVVMGSTVSSSALQTLSSYATTALEGTEAYVWKLEKSGSGFLMKNVSLKSNPYLKNSGSSTNVSFAAEGSVWAFNFQEGGTVAIQNTSNSDRFLGFVSATNKTYKAYAKSNLSGTNYPHAIVVYQLVDPSDSRTTTSIEFSEGYQTQIGGGPDGKFPQIGQSVALPTATVKAGNATVAGATIEWSLEVQSWKEGKEAPAIKDGKISFVDGAYGEVLVKASYAGNDSYKPSHKNYTLKVYKSYGLLSEMVNDIADPNFEKDDQDDKDGTLVFYFFRNIDAGLQSVQNTVTYVNGSYIYLTDGEKNLLFYGSNSQNLKAGDVISGNVNDTNLGGFWGSLKRRYKLPQFSFTDMNVKVESSGAAPDPKTITVDQLKDNLNVYVKIENAVFKSASGKTFTFTVGETEFTVYNQWSVADQSKDDKKLVETATYTLTGMGAVYKKDKDTDAVYQLYLASFTKTAEASVNAIKANAQFQGKMYNVAGQVVNKGYKGLVIQDGRKFVNK